MRTWTVVKLDTEVLEAIAARAKPATPFRLESANVTLRRILKLGKPGNGAPKPEAKTEK